MPNHKNPYPGSDEIYNSGRPFLGHSFIISYILILQMLHPNLIKIGPVVLEKMKLAHSERKSPE